jgi:hypothetical protein
MHPTLSRVYTGREADHLLSMAEPIACKDAHLFEAFVAMATIFDLVHTTRNGATLITPLPRPVSPSGLAPLRPVTPPRRAHTLPSNFYARLAARVTRWAAGARRHAEPWLPPSGPRGRAHHDHRTASPQSPHCRSSALRGLQTCPPHRACPTAHEDAESTSACHHSVRLLSICMPCCLCRRKIRFTPPIL